MRLLRYQGINLKGISQKFEKVKKCIEADDFYSPDIKKMHHDNYYRAKLDHTHRLLLKFVAYQNETVCLAVEVILNHAYDKSRFLRGATLNELQIDDQSVATLDTIQKDSQPVHFLNKKTDIFHILDKIISFNDIQTKIYQTPLPLILIGSAGSGKTALTLEKMRQVEGNLLYVTHSAYLAKCSQEIYTAYGYENETQSVQFLSYCDFLESIKVPEGREVNFTDFKEWFSHHRQNYRFTDAHQVFEEFRGVITSPVSCVLSKHDYCLLGVKQSIFLEDERVQVYDLFEKYKEWLKLKNYFDLNLVAHEWQAIAQAEYDFILVDEVQDLTNVQLALILKCLKNPNQFLLCGDANQVVHPNFFSWSGLRQLFWHDQVLTNQQGVSVLQVNFRNAQKIAELANNVLKIKQARFGSIDKESNFLVEAQVAQQGTVLVLPDKESTKKELNQKTRLSTEFAVLVLKDEDKAQARLFFNTPLIFSIHEAKGLEYKNIILYNLVSSARKEFTEICVGVSEQDLLKETLDYKRGKDKSDKSLEIYKFYINSLYVALTRAIEGVYFVESDCNHPLINLLKISIQENASGIQAKQSNREDWEQEAHRLAQQGKLEQASAIRNQILQTKAVPWAILDTRTISDIAYKALDPKEISNKPKQAYYDYALWHRINSIIAPLDKIAHYAPAKQLASLAEIFDYPYDYIKYSESPPITNARNHFKQKYLMPYQKKNIKDVLRQCDQYGVEHRTYFNATPLMMAAKAGNLALVQALIDRGAEKQAIDDFGHTPLMYAIDEACQNDAFSQEYFGEIYHALIYPIDLKVDDHLVRLYPQNGEYLFFMTMMARFKTLCSDYLTHQNVNDLKKMHAGFFAGLFIKDMQHFPESVLSAERKENRSYYNQILARAESDSNYQPARKLWLRMKTGHYLPNPSISIRQTDAQGISTWVKLYDYLNIKRVDPINTLYSFHFYQDFIGSYEKYLESVVNNKY